MASPGLRVLARALALICGCFLLLPLLMIQAFLTEAGGAPGYLTALLVVGFPCGLLLNFARTGRGDWRAGLFVPGLAVVQVVAVLAALQFWPHSRISHSVTSVAASWAVLLIGFYSLRLSQRSHAA